MHGCLVEGLPIRGTCGWLPCGAGMGATCELRLNFLPHPPSFLPPLSNITLASTVKHILTILCAPLMYCLNSTLTGHVASINALAFSPDGTYLASGADDGFIIVYDVASGREAHKLDGKSPVTALLWSGELYAGFADGRVARAELMPVRFSHLTPPTCQHPLIWCRTS